MYLRRLGDEISSATRADTEGEYEVPLSSQRFQPEPTDTYHLVRETPPSMAGTAGDQGAAPEGGCRGDRSQINQRLERLVR